MGELVLLVIAAAWAAVLVPPLIRNRLENRPNSSVTDFRRQLNKLQSTVPSRAGAPMRGMARPLAQSPLQRPAAGGRPGTQPAQLRRGAGGRSHGARQGTIVRDREPQAAARRRSHGDPTGGQRRPRPDDGYRRPVREPNPVSTELMRRRRTNVLFMLVTLVGATLFLAATTQSAAMLYVFAIAFLALCAYGYMLSQVRQRESSSWPQDWMQH
jgi:hypothetical protein